MIPQKQLKSKKCHKQISFSVCNTFFDLSKYFSLFAATLTITPAPAPALQACQHNHYICLLNGLSPFGIELRLLFLLRRNKLYRRLFLLYLFSIYQEAILRYLHNRDKLLIASYYLQWHTT